MTPNPPPSLVGILLDSRYISTSSGYCVIPRGGWNTQRDSLISLSLQGETHLASAGCKRTSLLQVFFESICTEVWSPAPFGYPKDTFYLKQSSWNHHFPLFLLLLILRMSLLGILSPGPQTFSSSIPLPAPDFAYKALPPHCHSQFLICHSATA